MKASFSGQNPVLTKGYILSASYEFSTEACVSSLHSGYGSQPSYLLESQCDSSLFLSFPASHNPCHSLAFSCFPDACLETSPDRDKHWLIILINSLYLVVGKNKCYSSQLSLKRWSLYSGVHVDLQKINVHLQ